MIIFHLDMVWNPSIDILLYNFPFCDDTMKKIREYAMLYPHLNYINIVDKNEMNQLSMNHTNQN